MSSTTSTVSVASVSFANSRGKGGAKPEPSSSGTPTKGGKGKGSRRAQDGNPKSAAKPDAPFNVILPSDVECIKLVGAGRFGSVFEAKWRGQTVAVKKTDLSNGEATALSSLRHRNIILFHGAHTEPSDSFIVTEFCR